jgi:hypothetical protein
MHNIKLIRRHFPNQAGKIIATLFIISCLLLALGIGLAILL